MLGGSYLGEHPFGGVGAPELAVTSVSETDAAQALVTHKAIALGSAPETDAAQALTIPDVRFYSASNSGFQTLTTGYSWSHTCDGENRVLVVGVGLLSVTTQTVTGITYDGAALTKLREDQSVGTPSERSELWYLVAPNKGTHAIAVTMSGAVGSAGVATAWSGVKQTTPLEGSSGATGVNGVAGSIVTTVTNRDMVVDVLSIGDPTIAPGAGQTQRANVSNVPLGSVGMSSEGLVTPAGARAMTWTYSGSTPNWASSAAALISFDATTTRALVPVGETDSAQGLTTLRPASEADLAQGLTASKSPAFLSAAEVDSAQALGFYKLAPAAESDTAEVLSYARVLSADEADSALELVFAVQLPRWGMDDEDRWDVRAENRWPCDDDDRWNEDAEDRWLVGAETRW